MSKVTADQLIRMFSPGKRFELKKGELIMMVPAGGEHGWVALRIGKLLAEHVDAKQLGRVFGSETGFRLERDPDTVLAPDVAFVAMGRLPARQIPVGYPELAPDLVVEVVSPGDSKAEVGAKARSWLDCGVLEVWVVDPGRRTLAVWTLGGTPRMLTDADEIAQSAALPAFRSPVAAFFPEAEA